MPKFEVILESALGRPIKGATTRLLVGRNGTLVTSATDGSGTARLAVPRDATSVRLEIGPIPEHWSVGEVCDFAGQPSRRFRAASLTDADEQLGWWHHAVGLGHTDRARGQGISIGVIDSGCGPHPALTHVEPIGTFIDGTVTSGIDDDGEHGSHVCGIITARPGVAARFIGIAPKAHLMAARVSLPGRYANQKDIADALDAMVEKGAHLVNISLAAQVASPSLIDAVANAWINGTVVFAAAGNYGDAVNWPARHELVVAVTALGRVAGVAHGSIAHLLLQTGSVFDAASDFVFPAFCSRGPGVNCCAPGVGIISTIRSGAEFPGGAWADMSGSSMASPLALGVLACVLSQDEEFLTMQPDEDRSKRAVQLLQDHCLPLGFPEDLQRNGLIMLDLAYPAT